MRTLKALAFGILLATAGDLAAQSKSEPQLVWEFMDAYRDQLFGQCRTILAELEEAYPSFAVLPELEFRLGRLLYESDASHLEWATEHLAKFLPGAPFAGAPRAVEARLYYAHAAADAGRWEEAGELLISGGAEAPSLRTALQAALTLRDVAKMSGDPELGAAAEAGLAVALVRFPGAAGRADALRFLNQMREESDGESSAGGMHSLGMGHYRLARHFDRLRLFSQAKIHWRQVDEIFTDLLDDYPPPAADSNDSEAADRSLRMRHRLGMAKYSLKQFEACSRLMAEVYSFHTHPALWATNFPLGALTWKTAADNALSLTNRNDEPVLEMLTSGKAGSGFIAWGFRTLASEARLREEAELEFLYLRDLVECLRPASKSNFRADVATSNSVERLREVEQARPELRAALADQRSSAFTAMSEAGLVLLSADSEPYFKTWNRDNPGG